MRSNVLSACLLLLTVLAGKIHAQDYRLSGRLLDEKAAALASGTVALLNPADSTMEFFAISNREGRFEIGNIRAGSYLLQASYVGYKAFYNQVRIPRAKGSHVGDLLMQPMPINLEGAEVIGEAVPLQIHGDTVVYNAAAFNTRPDDMTEELLKKLPGVEVDRSGNIKAMGEEVRKLYVDGKEFFGSDPTVATRNIPADAIDRVQVYDKKSDAAEFTGIDDGSRDKTVNLELKEEKKKGVFGDVLAGYGSGQRYKAGAKAYRFSDKVQIAGLGMINNVNEYGFSFSDYLNFKGGVSAMTGGAGSAHIKLTSEGELPVNFGQTIDGLTTSGAGGLNFSYSRDRNNRTYISYLLDGTDKYLERSTSTERFLEDGRYSSEHDLEQDARDLAHRVNFGLRRRIDSTHNLVIGGDLAFLYGSLVNLEQTRNLQAEQLVNQQLSDRRENSDRISGRADATYWRILGKKRSVLKLSAQGGFYKDLEKIRLDNQTIFTGLPADLFNPYQENRSDRADFSAQLSYTLKLADGVYLDPLIQSGGTWEHLDRVQSSLENGMQAVDSLSPGFAKQYQWLRPGLSFRWNTEKSKLSLGMKAELGSMDTRFNKDPDRRRDLFHLLPSLYWDYAWRSGRRISLSYSSGVNTPSVNQLLPVINDLNPLSLYYGNPDLKAEQDHRLMAHWLIFDQFSMTSLMVMLSGSYTSHKINWASWISDDLVQLSTLENVDWDYRASLSTDFSTPIRKLGMKINLDVAEDWNRGLSLINGMENAYHSLTQHYSLSADNRKKTKWDVESGLGFSLTHTWYDIQQSLNRRYFDLSWFSDLRFTPNDQWNFEFSADLSTYSDLNFRERLVVPLLRAGIGYSFLAHKRGLLSLSAHDLLDRNQNVERISELNYLRETRSNAIGRYFLLSFKYRLNKLARDGGLEINMKKRH